MLTFNMFWRFLREHNIDLAARKSWCESNDPEFAAKAADVVGLYIDPPAKAIVLCVDEKPSIQALERAQGYLKLPNGRASLLARERTAANATCYLAIVARICLGTGFDLDDLIERLAVRTCEGIERRSAAGHDRPPIT